MWVKEMALGDWARGRILDGAWLTSADVYFWKQGGLENPELGVRAVHLVSWPFRRRPRPPYHFFRSPYPRRTSTGPSIPRTPSRPIAPPPPTYALTEAAHNAHIKNMRTVLLPVFKNVVCRFISRRGRNGCSARAANRSTPPCGAARMSLADVVQQSREKGV
ncbi:hypothetical protein DFH08DRAFT_251290 [Mycena albidolilacea]|uniref:Uncharacterized protein n=1 Tax=Mycena albidolilacea TaxID=1033008 RepID=A0AAD7EM23_9AGAR|nr:hypothetical protein DFH08DRAFT_251290 [Mycena albidolilacea]